MQTRAKFHVGQLIHHRLFGYRGVVLDVDPYFKGSDDWYDQVAKTRPPKDRPWYHVLMDGADARAYVAERNLEPDETRGPVDHPDVSRHFEKLGADGDLPRRKGH